MAAVLAEQRPQQPRSEQNTPAAFLLALAMHALLVGALWISVQWRTEPAGAVVVELWSGSPPPEPVVVAPPPPPAPARQEPEPERPDADIVTRKEQKKPPPKAEPLPDPKKVEADKRRAEAEKRRVEAEKQRLDAEKKQLEVERRKQAEAAERKREDERRDAVRKAEQARMLAQAGSGAGSPGASAPAGGRGDAGYAGLLASVIKPRIVFSVPEGTSPNIYADFEVDLLPTGEILAVRLVKPSGLPGYDAAVERAIRRTDPFPRKADGTVERTVKLIFRPVEK